MDYDFYGLCVDQGEVLKKRLESLNKKYIKEYQVALNVINNKTELENRGETVTYCEDALREAITKCDVAYKHAMNVIQEYLGKHL